MLSLTFIASGSKGNCALLELENEYYLLDVGVSCKRIRDFLHSKGLELSDLSGVFITHEHTDHTNGLRVLLNKAPELPVYASNGTLSSLLAGKLQIKNQVRLSANKPIKLKECVCSPFNVPHDAKEPMGFRFSSANKAMSIATDLGYISKEVVEYMSNSDIICIESNYDQTMLKRCDYPLWLKRRIKSPMGHLANGGVCTLLERLNTVPKAIVLMHISQASNTPSLALDSLNLFFAGAGARFKTADLCIALQDSPSRQISV